MIDGVIISRRLTAVSLDEQFRDLLVARRDAGQVNTDRSETWHAIPTTSSCSEAENGTDAT